MDQRLNKAAGQRFHNHSPLDFEKLKGDPDNIEKHLVSYIKGFSKNVRDIFDFFEFENEVERMREANILYLVVSKFCDVDLHPNTVPNEQMGLIFENLIRRFQVGTSHLLLVFPFLEVHYGNLVFFGEAVDGFDVGLADLAEGRRGGDLEPLDPTQKGTDLSYRLQLGNVSLHEDSVDAATLECDVIPQ